MRRAASGLRAPGLRLGFSAWLEVSVKLRDGTPPFTILANGRPVATGLRQHELILPGLSRGFSELSVIDAKGRAARVRVRLD